MIGSHSPGLHATQSPLETYLQQINETHLLDAAGEKKLASRIAEGDAEAREHLVRANLRLVVNIARGYQGKGVDLHDLISEGNLGLLRATEGFDASLNNRFSTYASYWIKQSMRRALTNTAKTIRLPAYMEQLLLDWRRATAKLYEELGRSPTEDEIATRLELLPRQLKLVKKAIRIHGAMPQEGYGEDGTSFEEMVADERCPMPDVGMAKADDLRQVLGLVDKLSDREKAVLRLRFGLGGAEPKTLQQIGEQLDLTRERVRQIEREALNKLQEGLHAE